MRANKTKQIGEYKYEVSQLGGREGRRLLARLSQVLGSAIGALAAGGSIDAVKGVQAFAGQITPELMDTLCETFDKLTQVHRPDGKVLVLRDIFDDHFAANYGEMVEWLMFCLEVNYGNFLDGAGSLGGLFQRAPASSESKSPTG